MIRLLLAALLTLGSHTARAQQQVGPGTGEQQESKHWVVSETRVASTTARTSFPRVAGPVSLVGSRDFSHAEVGIDSALQYRSMDGEVIGTVYAYLPGLSHAGLAAYATELGIGVASNTPVTVSQPYVVPAGNVPGAAIRIDVSNYMGSNSSAAAFIKAGRWTIKFRVTGPEARRADVSAAMDALLAGIEFGRANRPHPAKPIAVADCAPGTGRTDARPLPDPAGANIAAHGFLATFDGAGTEATDEKGALTILPSRIPAGLCLSSRFPFGRGQVTILRSADGAPISISGRTRLFAIISDSGIWLEVVDAPNLGRHVILYHQIGSTVLLGGYDGVPSDQQIADLLNNPASDAARVRVPVTFRPDEGPAMHLPGLPSDAKPPVSQRIASSR